MAKTQAELVSAVLQDLDALGIGATASAEDTAVVTGRIAPLYADLAGRRILVVPDTNAIADQAFPALVRLLAETCAPMFGRKTDADAVKAAEAYLLALPRYAAATRTNLANAVLERLGALAAGQTPSADDTNAIANIVTPALADLSRRRIVTIADPAAVPDALFGDLVTILTERARPRFAAPLEPKLAALIIGEAEARLASASRMDRGAGTRALTLAVLEQLELWGAGTTTIDVAAVNGRLAGILADLAARNIVYISDPDNVPDAAMAHLTRHVAASLAPKPLLDVMAEAERALRRQARIGLSPAPLEFAAALRRRRTF